MSKFLKIGCALPVLAFLALLGWAVTIGGYSLNDPEIEEQGAWTRAFREDAPPELSRRIGRECKEEIARSPWTRDGAMALFTCIRRKAEAEGYTYEWEPGEAPTDRAE